MVYNVLFLARTQVVDFFFPFLPKWDGQVDATARLKYWKRKTV